MEDQNLQRHVNSSTFHKDHDPFESLPIDVVDLIYQRFDLVSRLRAPAVCRRWRATAKALLNPRSGTATQNQPWMLTYEQGSSLTHVNLLDFPPSSSSSMASAMVLQRRPIPALNVYPSPIFAGCCGNVLIVNDSLHFMDMSIVNPFSGESVPLPTKNAFDFPMWLFSIHLAKLSCPPTKPNMFTGECFAAGLSQEKSYMSFIYICRVDASQKWKICLNKHQVKMSDIAFYEGMLYAVDAYGCILIASLDEANIGGYSRIPMFRRGRAEPYDDDDTLAALRGMVELPNVHHSPNDYLVESSGELLLVRRRFHPLSDQVRFKVYKIEAREEDGRLRKAVPVEDLGNRMILVGKGCSISYECDASTSGLAPANFFIKNCIYFFWVRSSIGRFHLGKDLNNEYLQTNPASCDDSLCHPLWFASGL